MVIALRTVLVVAREAGGVAPMPSAPFSLKCDSEPFPSHFTFDRAAKLVVMESMAGRLIRGEIQEAETGRIRFSIDDGGEPFKMTWDKQRAVITVEGVPGESSRPTKVIACVEIAPRSIMILHNHLQ